MKNLITILSCVLVLTSYGQQLTMMNQNFIVPISANPAMVGNKPSIDLFFVNRNQWTNLPGSPVTNLLVFDSPIKPDVNGVGVYVLSDQVGIFTTTTARGMYAHQFNLGPKKRFFFRLGGSIGIMDSKADFTRAVVVDPNESTLFGTSQKKTNLNGSVGVMMKFLGLEAGFAANNVATDMIEFKDNFNQANYLEVRHFIAHASYNFTVNEKRGFSVRPYVLARITPSAPFQFDASVILNYQDRFWIAPSYKSNYALAVSAGMRLYNSFTVGYSYDLIMNSVAQQLGRSSELVLGYSFNQLEKKRTEALVDTDGDGVADEFDLEPNTLAGSMVNFQGRTIPLATAVAGNAKMANRGDNQYDKDNDFVPDSIDLELNTPAGLLVDARGRRLGNTHDLDFDGVADSVDAELGTRKGALVDEQGRRVIRDNEDLDEDGVNDKEDKELNTLEMSVVNADGVRIGSKYDLDDDGVADSVDVELNTARGMVVNHYGKGVNITINNAADSIQTLYETSFFFDYDKYYVKPGKDEQFASIARYLFANKQGRIVLTGHTDSRGNAAYNLNLGQRRAQAIANVLMNDYNVPADRIQIVMSKGSAEPLSPTKHHINRRVDVNVVNENFFKRK